MTVYEKILASEGERVAAESERVTAENERQALDDEIREKMIELFPLSNQEIDNICT